MKFRFFLCAGLLASGPAMALDVYPGCEVPTAPASHNTFFIDAVNGSDAGDGSAQRPWKSLNTVLAGQSKLIATNSHPTVSGSALVPVNPNAPIKGGDTIMLMSGDYGDVLLINAFNDKFITVTAAPGQAPTIGHLKIGGVARWIFQGLTFQSSYPSGSPPNANSQVSVSDGWGDVTRNVIFDSDTFQAMSDTSGWSDLDWYRRPNFFALSSRSGCVAVTNSILKNVLNGLISQGAQVLIKGNRVDGFSNDAMEITGSNTAVLNNVITNAKNAGPMNNPAGGIHPDAIQVWSPIVSGAPLRSNNLLIDSNTITNPKGRSDNYLQGINVGYFDNVVLQNNVIVTNHWLGLSLSGSRNSQIINNTVMPSDPIGHLTFILVAPNFGNSQNILVRNNVAGWIRAEDQSITMDHNTVSWAYTSIVSGRQVFSSKSDSSAKNLVQPTLGSAFRGWAPANNAFDLHLADSSSLDSVGSQLMAPNLDADGRVRSTPTDLGAYSR